METIQVIKKAQLSELLAEVPRPSEDIVARYGALARRLWVNAITELKIVTQSEDMKDCYNVRMDVLQNPEHNAWEEVRNQFASTLSGAEVVAPSQGHSVTSIEASMYVKEKAKSLRQMVLSALQEKAMTDVEIAEELGLEGSTARPRRIELVQMGLVHAVGFKQKQGHRRSTLWQAV